MIVSLALEAQPEPNTSEKQKKRIPAENYEPHLALELLIELLKELSVEGGVCKQQFLVKTPRPDVKLVLLQDLLESLLLELNFVDQHLPRLKSHQQRHQC